MVKARFELEHQEMKNAALPISILVFFSFFSGCIYFGEGLEDAKVQKINGSRAFMSEQNFYFELPSGFKVLKSFESNHTNGKVHSGEIAFVKRADWKFFKYDGEAAPKFVDDYTDPAIFTIFCGEAPAGENTSNPYVRPKGGRNWYNPYFLGFVDDYAAEVSGRAGFGAQYVFIANAGEEKKCTAPFECEKDDRGYVKAKGFSGLEKFFGRHKGTVFTKHFGNSSEFVAIITTNNAWEPDEPFYALLTSLKCGSETIPENQTLSQHKPEANESDFDKSFNESQPPLPAQILAARILGKSVFEQGEPVEFTVKNLGDKPIFSVLSSDYGHNHLKLYQLNAGKWARSDFEKVFQAHGATTCGIESCKKCALAPLSIEALGESEKTQATAIALEVSAEKPYEFLWNQAACASNAPLYFDECFEKGAACENKMMQSQAGKYKAEFCFFELEQVSLDKIFDPAHLTVSEVRGLPKCVEKNFSINAKPAAVVAQNCEEIESSQERAKCFFDLAKSQRAATYCYYSGSYADECLTEFAVKNAQAPLCEATKAKTQFGTNACLAQVNEVNPVPPCRKRDGIYRDMCYSELAQKEKYPALCEAITDEFGVKDICYNNIAIYSKNQALCANVVDENLKTNCLIGSQKPAPTPTQAANSTSQNQALNAS